MKELQVVRNYNHANVMLKQGHTIVKIDRDIRDRRFLIFFFKNSEELQKDLNAITPKK